VPHAVGASDREPCREGIGKGGAVSAAQVPGTLYRSRHTTTAYVDQAWHTELARHKRGPPLKERCRAIKSLPMEAAKNGLQQQRGVSTPSLPPHCVFIADSSCVNSTGQFTYSRQSP
jgi:hypothetical protein